MSKFEFFEGLWQFEVFGDGSEIMLAYHGFGNHYSDFKVFEPSLGKKFKIISFNLPYHGKNSSKISLSESESKVASPSFGGVGEAYNKEDLKQLFEKFLSINNVETFSVMGYSLGGKIALQMIELFPERINTVILFAPDGIQNKWEYNFVTNTAIGERLYSRIINDPSGFFRIVKLMKTFRIINPKIADFVHHQLSTLEKRKLVWDVWRCFRHIKPDIENIKHLINRNKINIQLFFGKYDSIIPPAIGEKFVHGLKNRNALHIVDCGHNLIRERINTDLNYFF